MDSPLKTTTTFSEVEDFVRGVAASVASFARSNKKPQLTDADLAQSLLSWLEDGENGPLYHISRSSLKRLSFLLLQRGGGVEQFDIELEIGTWDDEEGCSHAVMSSLDEYMKRPQEASALDEAERFLSMELELRHVPAKKKKKKDGDGDGEGEGGTSSNFTTPTPYPAVTRPPQSPIFPPVHIGSFTASSGQRVKLSTSCLPPTPDCQPIVFGTLPPLSSGQLPSFSQNTASSLKTFGSEETKTIVLQTPGTKEGPKSGVVYRSLLEMYS